MDRLFIGYDKDFYDAIPYVKIEPDPDEDPHTPRWAIDPSFVGIASKLLFRKNNAKVYEEYGLPDDDDIRGYILEHPELLFFAPELKRLFDLIKDERTFAGLLRNPYLVNYLNGLHDFRGIFVFLELFLDVLGTEALTAELASDRSFIIEAGKGYCAMGVGAKRRAPGLLKTSVPRNALKQIAWGFDYSIPSPGLNRHENDRAVGNHTIERIASSHEAGNANRWIKGNTRNADDWPDVFVYDPNWQFYWVRDERDLPVAVLEIINGELTRIVTDRDVSLTENGLLAAILNWLLDVGYSMGKDTLKEEGE
ncbi:MAG: hypothetical protein J6P98_00925 [Clostridia bacterium]|nr:hypothetical protein [Clostridia bacterium]